MIRKFVCFLAVVAFSGAESVAARIGSIDGSLSPSSTTGSSISLTSASVTTGAINTTSLSNEVTLNLSVSQLLSPTTFNFDLTHVASGGGSVETGYWFTVNITNDTTTKHPLSGFDMRYTVTGSSWVGELPPDLPANATVTTSDFFVDPNYRITNPGAGNSSTTDNTYRFGGLSGSGGFIPWNSTGQVKFFATVGKFNGNNVVPGNLALTFTANPEPTTLLLGSLVMVPAGIAIRRRRKAAAAIEAAV